LVQLAPDLIHVEVSGRADGGTGVDYTVTAALRHRDASGAGARISIPLENVALATAGNLSFLTEVMVNGVARQRIGNSLYGTYGQHFTTATAPRSWRSHSPDGISAT
jgi:2-methylfumaryl-CoA isomerase